MATFPVYASLLRDGFAEKRDSALLRTEMESGPAKQARIKSRVMVTRPVKVFLKSKSDYQSFVDWFATDLDEGASWFDWRDPVSGTVKSGRFVGGGLDAAAIGMIDGAWSISLNLETWG